MRSLRSEGINPVRVLGAGAGWRRSPKQFLILKNLSEGQPRNAATGLKQKIASETRNFSFLIYLVYKNSSRLSMTFTKSTSEADWIISSTPIDSSLAVGGRVNTSR